LPTTEEHRTLLSAFLPTDCPRLKNLWADPT